MMKVDQLIEKYLDLKDDDEKDKDEEDINNWKKKVKKNKVVQIPDIYDVSTTMRQSLE